MRISDWFRIALRKAVPQSTSQLAFDADHFVAHFDHDEREGIRYALETGFIDDVPTAIASLTPGRKTEVIRAIVSLAASKAPAAVEPLTAMLSSDGYDWEERSVAVTALGYIGDARAVEPLLRVLNMDQRDYSERGFYHEREKAVQALGLIRDPKAYESLCDALWRYDSVVQEKAAVALRQIDSQRAVAPLVGALKSQHWTVRERAAILLGEIGDPTALQPLTKLAETAEAPDQDEPEGIVPVRQAALDAIKRIHRSRRGA